MPSYKMHKDVDVGYNYFVQHMLDVEHACYKRITFYTCHKGVVEMVGCVQCDQPGNVWFCFQSSRLQERETHSVSLTLEPTWHKPLF
jgi:hypothetical protein